MPLRTTQWDPAEYLDSDGEIAAYLEAALDNGDPALIGAARSDIECAKAKHAATDKFRRPIMNDEGEVRELKSKDFAKTVPFSALPESERNILLSLRKSDAMKPHED